MEAWEAAPPLTESYRRDARIGSWSHLSGQKQRRSRRWDTRLIDSSERESRSELELAWRIHGAGHLAELLRLRWIREHRRHVGHVGISQLRVVGNVVRRDLKAQIAFPAKGKV